MTAYRYLVKTPEGQTLQGKMDAQNEGDVINELRSKGYLIVEIAKAKAETIKKSQKKISMDDLVTFTRQMATMIDAGLPLLQALHIMSEQLDNINFRSIVSSVAEDIEGGSTFSDALSKHPKAFDKLYCAMIRVGEASGMFAEILVKIATYMEDAAKLRRKVKSAMIYPGVVSGMALLITTLLLIKVVPTFKEIFEGFGADLPGPTQLVVNLSEAMRSNFMYMVFFVVGMVFAVRAIYRTNGGRMFLDRLTFKLPIFGDILKKAALSRFTKTFGTLVASGVPMLQSLEIVESVAGNMTLEVAIRAVYKKVEAGEGVAGPLLETKEFPPMVVRMIDVGERTGKLDLMLQKISEFYDDQVNNAVSALTSLIEPLLIAFLGVVVGGIVIAMFLPIFKLSEIVG